MTDTTTIIDRVPSTVPAVFENPSPWELGGRQTDPAGPRRRRSSLSTPRESACCCVDPLIALDAEFHRLDQEADRLDDQGDREGVDRILTAMTVIDDRIAAAVAITAAGAAVQFRLLLRYLGTFEWDERCDGTAARLLAWMDWKSVAEGLAASGKPAAGDAVRKDCRRDLRESADRARPQGPAPRQSAPICTAPTAPGMVLPPVLLWTADEGWTIGYWCERGWFEEESGFSLQPTVWASLPPPPATEA